MEDMKNTDNGQYTSESISKQNEKTQDLQNLSSSHKSKLVSQPSLLGRAKAVIQGIAWMS